MHLPINPSFREYSTAYTNLRNNPLANTSASFVATIVVILILFTVVIRPTILTISSLQEKAEEYETLNAKLEKKKQSLVDLVAEYSKLQTETELSNLAIPPKPDFLLYEKQLRFLTQKHLLTVTALSFSGFPLVGTTQANDKAPATTTNTLPAGLSAISYSITVSGDYQDIKDFINEVSNLIRIVSLDSYSFQTNSYGSGGKVSILMTGKIYYKA